MALNGNPQLPEDLFASEKEVRVPSGAESLFPNNIGPRLFALHGENQILKAGASVKMSEAEAMRFVARNTRIPVPHVYQSYTEDGIGYIFMTRLEGVPLADVWNDLALAQRAKVVAQLKTIVQELSQLQGDFFGALWNKPCEDVFFTHLPFKQEKITYGPFFSRQEYNHGLVHALGNSRPDTAPDTTEELAKRLFEINDDVKIFTHGDFHPLNILVDKSTARVTGIVDWECAGFSIRGREYYEAMSRARNSEWLEALGTIFPAQERAHFELLQELDQALTQYTFI